MQVSRQTSETGLGPKDWFSGAVYIDTIRNPSKLSRLAAASVRFAPGARTAWHTHPNGQTLYVTEGVGVVQGRGGAIEVILPGDVVWIEPKEDHWHGAARGHFMTHIAMQEADSQGNVVAWGRQVTDEEYDKQPGS